MEVWHADQRPGQVSQDAVQPHKQITDAKPRGTYKGAKLDAPATWGTFDQCVTALQDWRGWFQGIGLVLGADDTGIDVDGCVAADGTLRSDVAQLIQQLAGRAYIERSVSGKGVHLIVQGRIPASVKQDGIELYPGSAGRYFTLSGDELPGSAAPPMRRRCLIGYMPPTPPRRGSRVNRRFSLSAQWRARLS